MFPQYNDYIFFLLKKTPTLYPYKIKRIKAFTHTGCVMSTHICQIFRCEIFGSNLLATQICDRKTGDRIRENKPGWFCTYFRMSVGQFKALIQMSRLIGGDRAATSPTEQRYFAICCLSDCRFNHLRFVCDTTLSAERCR